MTSKVVLIKKNKYFKIFIIIFHGNILYCFQNILLFYYTYVIPYSLNPLKHTTVAYKSACSVKSFLEFSTFE